MCSQLYNVLNIPYELLNFSEFYLTAQIKNFKLVTVPPVLKQRKQEG